MTWLRNESDAGRRTCTAWPRSLEIDDGQGSGSGHTIGFFDATTHCIGWGSAGSSFAATSVPVAADASFTANLLDLGVVVDNSSGTPVAHFYSAGVEVCRITTNIPATTVTFPAYMGWFTSHNNWSAATYGLDIDWTKVWVTEPARCAPLLPGE